MLDLTTSMTCMCKVHFERGNFDPNRMLADGLSRYPIEERASMQSANREGKYLTRRSLRRSSRPAT